MLSQDIANKPATRMYKGFKAYEGSRTSLESTRTVNPVLRNV
jgi:hypothetical protein